MQCCRKERVMSKNKCSDCPYHSEKCDQIAKSRPALIKSPHDTLCWCCIHAVPDGDQHGCPWSELGEPVPGWEMEEVTRKMNNGNRKSYFVKTCPMFERG